MKNDMEDNQIGKPLSRDPVQVGMGMRIDDREEEKRGKSVVSDQQASEGR